MMKNILVIAGPTAVGKTKYAIEAAKTLNGEIVSCDSMQLYKYMDIGSAKPTEEERNQVEHHLVDVIDPAESFSVAIYQKMAKEAINEIFQKEKVPVIAGGTGLYLNSIMYDMDFSNANQNPKLRLELNEKAETLGLEYLYNQLKELDGEAAKRIHQNNKHKVIRALEAAMSGDKIKDFKGCTQKCQDYNVILIGLIRDREELYNRINERVDLLVQEGLFQEVERLLKRGLTADDISMKGIGYKEIIGYFNNLYSYDETIDLIKKNTRHFAKRQITWFKRYDNMRWLNISEFKDDNSAIEEMKRWLKNDYGFITKAINQTM